VRGGRGFETRLLHIAKYFASPLWDPPVSLPVGPTRQPACPGPARQPARPGSRSSAQGPAWQVDLGPACQPCSQTHPWDPPVSHGARLPGPLDPPTSGSVGTRCQEIC
jgi:hypothetical protein